MSGAVDAALLDVGGAGALLGHHESEDDPHTIGTKIGRLPIRAETMRREPTGGKT